MSPQNLAAFLSLISVLVQQLVEIFVDPLSTYVIRGKLAQEPRLDGQVPVYLRFNELELRKIVNTLSSFILASVTSWYMGIGVLASLPALHSVQTDLGSLFFGLADFLSTGLSYQCRS